ncbi:TetR/AcrR family transcriptional regulator [Paenimyroides aestuarii]|uniref:TetR/AcrR family transcriptional regulator n=1 Tax=Paenimyroides aestuarii TaxID=2968490 RepID=A0ABY5NUQ6_9FLAO|nr:TetR/AcrR family transcriptional regulator [Paenimyroides aestuarii]UUV22299.1 TetR/AcrR family transcriptional regulator [Paenimyroides aestuarii]
MQRIEDHQKNWIAHGYETFALHGQAALKIEPLAKKVGKSKSSFYHHFADMDLFVDLLLQHHVAQSKIIALKEQQAQSVHPDLVEILVTHKTDLLFNRQLRFQQHIPAFAAVLHQSNQIVGDAFVKLWVKDLGLQLSAQQINGIFSLALENFFLQINHENLNHTWLSAYFENLKAIAKSFA